MAGTLRLRDVRAAFRLIGEIRAIGSDPAVWRTHMVRRLRKQLAAEIVISSEVHVRELPGRAGVDPSLRKIVDIGWGCDGAGGNHVWRIFSEDEALPEQFLLSMLEASPSPMTDVDQAVRPLVRFRAGKSFVLSQCALPHLGTVDQLGVHRDATQQPFTDAEHRLIKLFHNELGRLWRNDALARAKDPDHELPPRLAQTLVALQQGDSEKQVSLRLGISRHTVHNYVKALHQRLGVSSRGELLAKAVPADRFLPKFSVNRNE